MVRYIIIALAWLVVFGGIALVVVVVERLRRERKQRIYERNFEGMGFDSPDTVEQPKALEDKNS